MAQAGGLKRVNLPVIGAPGWFEVREADGTTHFEHPATNVSTLAHPLGASYPQGTNEGMLASSPKARAQMMSAVGVAVAADTQHASSAKPNKSNQLNEKQKHTLAHSNTHPKAHSNAEAIPVSASIETMANIAATLQPRVIPTADMSARTSAAELDLDSEQFFDTITKALNSKLPNAVDWAFQMAQRVTNSQSLDFLEHHTEATALLDAIMDQVPIEHFVKSCTIANLLKSDLSLRNDQMEVTGPTLLDAAAESGSDIATFINLFELRIMQAASILYNFAADVPNRALLASHKRIVAFVLRGIASENTTCSNCKASVLPALETESDVIAKHAFALSRTCKDIFSNLAGYIELSALPDGWDFIMNSLCRGLYSADRSNLCSSLSSLSQLATLDKNKLLLKKSITVDILQRLSELLLVEDIEVQLSTLELMYRITLWADFALLVGKMDECVSTLVARLDFRADHFADRFGNDGTLAVRRKRSRPVQVVDHNGPVAVATLSWLRGNFAKSTDKTHGIRRDDLYEAYVDSRSGLPVLTPIVFGTVLRKAFPNVSERVLPGVGSVLYYVGITGVQPRKRRKTTSVVNQKPTSETSSRVTNGRAVISQVDGGADDDPNSSPVRSRNPAPVEEKIASNAAPEAPFSSIANTASTLSSRPSNDAPIKRPGRRSNIDPSLKKFICPTPGCGRAYTNPNGLHYHLSSGGCRQVLGDDAIQEHDAIPDKVGYYRICDWRDCKRGFTNSRVLAQHIGDYHASRVNYMYGCGWAGCEKFAQPATRRSNLISHTHSHVSNARFVHASSPELNLAPCVGSDDSISKHGFGLCPPAPTEKASAPKTALGVASHSADIPKDATGSLLQGIGWGLEKSSKRRLQKKILAAQLLRRQLDIDGPQGYVESMPVNDTVVKAVQITAALVLRNIARVPENAMAMLKHEETILRFVLSDPNLCSTLSEILLNLQRH